jgi:hypothetical protein
MLMVLLASNHEYAHWVRIVTLVYLFGVMFFFLAAAVIAKHAEDRSRSKSKAEPDAPSDRGAR